ncbi:helix-turn-helix transcriptional regulator [Microbacterium oleivorans]|uniref:Helix-turn-helix domain-containing protein n=1 Tax=Microbacterium oleivorans TaxID=273677 RepID=A0A7D5ERQ0_9MICO|nr:helix-turn-helix transcriptional regulator [Microbacterium oleivorans]QLD11325.1 helix-turn-helix domain-containing protein [Microbacterium oleivorans]
MDNRTEVRGFLTSRRARVAPEQAGILAGGNRRVPGLRRGEVAMLAGISVEYYGKIERGDIAGASDAVLGAIARALRLSDAERAHLFDLARGAHAPVATVSRTRAGAVTSMPRPMQTILDAITGGPALVRNGRMDILATNPLARGLHAETLDAPARGNIARYTFLDPRARDFYPDPDSAADIVVAILRTEAGRDPHDAAMHDLVDELSGGSESFRTRWNAHEVRQHGGGAKRFIHRAVGELSFAYEEMQFVQHPGLTFLVYVPEPGSPSEERMRLLASWQATGDLAEPATAGEAQHHSR